MKTLYVNEVKTRSEVKQDIELLGWICSKREHGSVIFFDLQDSTGSIQVVVSKDIAANAFGVAQRIVPESSVRVKGTLKPSEYSLTPELEAHEIEIIGTASLNISPRPRAQFDIFAQRYTDLSLRKRHLYLRNDKLMAVLIFRHKFLGMVHDWFRKQGFIEINAPILTQLPLYDEGTAFALDFGGDKVFLTQCVAFYLESAVHAFEKVYNIGPSFRAEESTGKRHLAEYWHVKAEIAFADLEDIICFAEGMISHILHSCASVSRKELASLNGVTDIGMLVKTPYPRITYEEALRELKKKGVEVEWGKSLSSKAEAVLSQEFVTPFWVTGLPRSIEPFPYVVDPSDPQVTKTADLIAPEGFGELLGVAEKIWKPDELLERMREKGKDKDSRYDWYCELRQYGSVPHSGLGMGVERCIRWLLRLSHVRDAIPFPRLLRRTPYP